MSNVSGPEKTRKSHRVLKFGGVVVLLCLILLALAWVFRISLAEKALGYWCARKDLVCTASIETLTRQSIVIRDLEISSGDVQPFTAEAITAEMSWHWLLAPGIDSIAVTRPVFRAAYDGEALSFYGLRRLAAKSDAPTPQVSVTDGQVFIDTPAGEVSASVNLSGTLADTGTFEIRFDPAELVLDDKRLILTRGDIHLQSTSGKISGETDFDLQAAAFGPLSLTGAQIHMDVEEAEASPVIIWSGSVDHLQTANSSVSELMVSGQVQIADGFSGNITQLNSALEQLAFDIKATAVSYQGTGSGALAIQGDFARTNKMLAGPVSASVENLTSEYGSASLLTLSGDARINIENLNLETFAGAIIVKQANLEPDLRQSIVSGIAIPGPFSSHASALRSVISRGLSEFDTGAELVARNTEAGWTIDAGRASALRGASGLTLSIEPYAGKDWLSVQPGSVTLSGDFVMAGGGAPATHVELDRFSRTGDSISIDTRHVSLARWEVDGRAISGRWDRFTVDTGLAHTRLVTSGYLEIDGEIFGVVFDPTRLTGGVEAVKGGEGWRVQMLSGGTCLDFNTQGMRSGVIQILPVSVDLCPEDGRFIREETDRLTGLVQLGDISIPFRTNAAEGVLNLTAGSLDWHAATGLEFSVSAQALDLPMRIGERTLDINGEAPNLFMRSGEGPLVLKAKLGASVFSGSMVPANVSMSGLDFDGYADARGLTGHAKAPDVVITDFRDDPMYKPLRASFTAELDNGSMHMQGPVRLASSGLTIADTVMTIQLATMTGTASVQSRVLTFAQEGLQPTDLSDRLLGVLSNARGAMQGSAALVIEQGELSGTGHVKVDNFGVDTYRIGPVDGVNGEIIFDDIFGFSTPPNQTLTIEKINPGVELLNGHLAFQLLDWNEARLEEAVWPFAGGELVIEPTSWHVSGETDRIDVRADKIDLAELTMQLGIPDFQASGTVSGVFPIDIIGPNAYIRDATLKADETGGHLSYTGEAGEQASGAGANAKLAFDALRNFQFSVLELGMNGNIAGNMIIRVKLIGHNPDILGGADFLFNVSVDSKLAELLRTGQRAFTNTWVIDTLRERVAEDPDQTGE